MSNFVKNVYLILFLITTLLFNTETFSRDTKLKYSKDDISNYFSGILSVNRNYTTTGFKYLNKVQSLKNKHSNFNVQFIRAMILLEKFDQAFAFSKDVWVEEELFFEADLLLGLNSLINKDYLKAEKHFQRLNIATRHNFIFEDLLGNILISWIRALENNKEESFKFFDKIPERYQSVKQIQNAFLQCYFDTSKTEVAFEQLTNKNGSSFSRYNFFLANYFLSKKENIAGEIIIKNSRNVYNANLLIKQAENFVVNGKEKKITKIFDCKNPNDVIAEIFYVIANLYSTQENYQLSNFYLKISLFLNKKFLPNKTLLAENFFNQKKYELAKKAYNSIKTIGSAYSWYASINLALILSQTANIEQSVLSLEQEFNLLPNPDYENYYEIANFYKDNKYYEKSITYYSLALKNIKQDHPLIAKIFDRRGTSYERIDEWEKAEKDLKESLRILPNQPHVLNYLAYSWIEKRINIEEALEMLIQATHLKENDGYIIDSLGWAHYVSENYIDAEKYLRRAVEIMPSDPIINDHYADTLWMLNKNIQARYFWRYVLSLDDAEQELKDNINKKLIFGITKKI